MRNILEKDPNDARIGSGDGRAGVFALYDDLEKATMLFQRALHLDPQSLVTLLYLGNYSLQAMGMAMVRLLRFFNEFWSLHLWGHQHIWRH